MRVPSSMAISSTAVILYPKRPGAPLCTSTVIEASRGDFFGGRLAFPAVAWFGGVDAEGLPEASPSQRGDDDGVAALHPFDPAEIEAALADRRPNRPRDVRASLGPIEAESAEVPAGRTPHRKPDAERGEEPGACCRDLRGFVVEHEILARDQRISEINAEASGQMVVADPGRAQRACLPG